VLCQRHKYAQAVREAGRLQGVEPSRRNYRILLANAHVGLGDHEEGLRIYRDLLAETPDNAELHLSVAHALKTLGRQPESIPSHCRAAAPPPRFRGGY